MRYKILLLFVAIIIFSLFVYLFILPPKVISIYPPNNYENLDLNSSITIRFDRPIDRQTFDDVISPTAYGEWNFTDSLFGQHLFRTAIFIPSINFEPNTTYKINLKRISNPFMNIGIYRNQVFSFRTKSLENKYSYQKSILDKKLSDITLQSMNIFKPEGTINLQESIQDKPKITLLNIPIDYQDYPLSCEAASLKMALGYKGKKISEKDIMRDIGQDLTSRINNIWGNPYETFVGSLYGKSCVSGYGVYWDRVSTVANNWKSAESFSHWELGDIIREIQNNNPIIMWGVIPNVSLHDCSWNTALGAYIKAFKETHVRLIVGFVGDANNPTKIILNDPLSGRLYWDTAKFLDNWKKFDNSGVVVRGD